MAYWAVPEGWIGDTINAISEGFGGTTDVTWHVVEDATKPNSNAHGPYATKQQAQNAVALLNATADPLAITANSSDTAPSTTGLTGGLNDIGNFFHALTETATWERVGEVVLGALLLYAGVRALTSGSSAVGSGARKAATVPVKKVARKATKVAAPEVRLATRTAAKRVAPKTTARVAAHRQRVATYGARKPYVSKPPKPPTRVQHTTTKKVHVYHHKGP